MKLIGRIIKGSRIVKETYVVRDEANASFRDTLEDCFVRLCKELDVAIPLWLKKNTSEFAAFRRTTFTGDQFMESVSFDKLEVKIEM